MSFIPHGKHLVAGAWVSSAEHFSSSPASGPAHRFCAGTVDLVAQACAAAEEAFWSWGYAPREERALFLEAVAAQIEARGAIITRIGVEETGLPAGRLDGERGRTVGQLRLFASHIRKGEYLDRRHDPALPDRQPLPRPDLRLMERPVGPVAVFGASNFPLAFSTAGGDTAAAWAAGCPVVVRGHSAHPGTGEVVAEAILAAILETGAPKGIFSLIQGGGNAVGGALVTHPEIKAVGFTGSLAGGRALFDLCAAREEPIPFFGELGSVNPMFLLPAAVAARGESIGAGWAASLTLGAGQFCTNPGIAVILDGPEGDRVVAAAAGALRSSAPQVMLSEGIAQAYRKGVFALEGHGEIRPLVESRSAGREAGPGLYEVSLATFMANHALSEEVFGPLGLVVRVPTAEAMVDFARGLKGQLTVTIHMDDADHPLAGALLPVLERKAGRVLANGFPTGVEVADAMVHGGPYPASTNFGATSVGTLSIRRFLRPVSYQNIPEALLPADLREGAS